MESCSSWPFSEDKLLHRRLVSNPPMESPQISTSFPSPPSSSIRRAPRIDVIRPLQGIEENADIPHVIIIRVLCRNDAQASASAHPIEARGSLALSKKSTYSCDRCQPSAFRVVSAVPCVATDVAVRDTRPPAQSRSASTDRIRPRAPGNSSRARKSFDKLAAERKSLLTVLPLAHFTC
jgi:hypothetical protein